MHSAWIWICGAAFLFVGGCLGRPRHNAALEQITRAPGAIVGLPRTGSRPYWLLREEAGWLSAHETRFGDAEGAGPLLIVRAAQFRDARTASHALAHLTPDAVWRAFPSGGHDAVPIAMPPHVGSTTEGAAFAYTPVRTGAPGAVPEGFLIMARVGVVVLLIDAVGITLDELESPVAVLILAVEQVLGPSA